MKRFLSILLVCLMVMSMLAGCGGGDAEEAGGNEGGAVGVGEGKEINMWICQWGGENFEDAIEALGEEATAANIGDMGLKVNVEMISWDGFYETFMTAYTSNVGPEVASQANTAPILYHMQDMTCDLMPIYDQWVEEGNPIIEAIPQEFFDFFTVDGKLIAMPFGSDTSGLFYNKELLADIGITEVPTTWDDLLTACDALKAKYPDKAGFLFAADTPASCSNFGNWLLATHNTYYKSLEHCSNLDSPEAQKSLENFKALVDGGYVSEACLTYTSDDVRRVFLNGDALFTISGLPTWIPVEDAEKYGVLEPLSVDGTRGFQSSAVNAYYIASSENDKEAMAVLKWWMENNYSLWAEGEDGNIPARADYARDLYAENPLSLEFYNSTLGSGLVMLDCAPFENQDETASDFDNEATMGYVISDLLNGKSVQEAADHGSQVINDIYAKYGY